MALPECFGIFWEGIASSPDCNEVCGAKAECLSKFATGVLVKYQTELGDAATVHALAELTGVKPEAILLAINYQKEAGLQKAEPIQRTPLIEPEPAQAEVPMPPPAQGTFEVPAPPVVSAPAGLPEPPVMPATEVPVAPEPEIEPEPDPELETAPEIEEEPVAKSEKKATPKKRAAPKKKAAPATKTDKAKPKSTKKAALAATPKKKVPPRKKKGATTANFPKAGAASPVAVPAKAAKAKRATRATAPEPARTWSPEHDLARWTRERKRNPLVRMLPEGYALEREYPMNSGEIHRVVVANQSYLYRGQQYPTLYAVLKEITGTKTYKKQLRSDGTRPRGTKQTTTWSVTKFFSLAKLMLTPKEERQGKGRNRLTKRQQQKQGYKKPPSKRPGKPSRPKK